VIRDSKERGGYAQRGFSIVTAVFLIVVLGLLGIFIVAVVGMQQQSQALDVQGVRAYQAARAGIEWGAFQVLDPSHGGVSALANCAAVSPIPLPDCPATNPTHLSGLGGSLSAFTVTVQCTLRADTTEGNRRVRVYDIVATACNEPNAGSCLGTTPSTGYVARSITATLTKCRDSTAALPRCACG
jgi:MSHA biogenesis protein MshP